MSDEPPEMPADTSAGATAADRRDPDVAPAGANERARSVGGPTRASASRSFDTSDTAAAALTVGVLVALVRLIALVAGVIGLLELGAGVASREPRAVALGG